MPSTIRKIIDYFHRYVLVVVVRFVCSVLFGVGAKINPVRNDILNRPASRLAEQIRTKEVSPYYFDILKLNFMIND